MSTTYEILPGFWSYAYTRRVPREGVNTLPQERDAVDAWLQEDGNVL